MEHPNPLKQSPKNKTKDKWYAFHKDYEYDTKYYWDLDRVLNDLANKEKMNKYLKNKPYKKRKHFDERISEEDDSQDSLLKGSRGSSLARLSKSVLKS